MVTFFILLFLLSLTAPVGRAAPQTQNPSPFGSTPGGATTFVPVGNAGGSQNAAVGFVAFELRVRVLSTLLAVLSGLLVTATYAVLIGPGTRLATTSKLPLTAIESNIGKLLSYSWPDKSTDAGAPADKDNNSTSAGDGSAAQSLPVTPDPVELEAENTKGDINIFYVGKFLRDEQRVARGIEQCGGALAKRLPRSPMWLTTGSSLTKYIVQIVVWEWVSLYLFACMFISTLAFNGFTTGHRRPDSYARLTVIMIYLIGFAAHGWYVWRTCRAFFTLVVAGASWSMLHKASFAAVDREQLLAHLRGQGPLPTFRKLGRPVKSSGGIYPVYDDCHLKDVPPLVAAPGTAGNTQVPDKGASDTVNWWHEKELATTLESGRVALDRTVTNVMTLVGITITTGFASWTSVAASTDGTAQLGSLALLGSLTLGAGAMFSSAVDLNAMLNSFRNIVFLKEVLLNGKANDYIEKRLEGSALVGFTLKTLAPAPVRMRDLMKHGSLWGLALFGAGYTLLPSKEDQNNQIGRAEFEFELDIRGKKVIFTTEERKGDGEEEAKEVNSINVCYVAD